MNDDPREGLAELRLSPRPVLAGLVVVGAVLYLLTEILPYPADAVNQTIARFLAICALSGLGWLLVDRRPALARGYTALLMAGVTLLIVFNRGLPISPMWIALPPMLTIALIDVRAAVLIAALESLITLLSFTAAGVPVHERLNAVLMTWAALVATTILYRPFQGRIQWLNHYFDRAQQYLEEARERRAGYEQTLEDLTHANRQLVLMNQRVANLRQAAEEAQNDKTRFVARVSHEFRTPLNMIIGLVDLMVDSPEIYDIIPSPRMREALQVVHRNCEHLAHMVNDVLDLTRLERDRVTLHKERIQIGAVVASASEAVRPLLESKNLDLQIQIPPDIDKVYCDRTRIEQVILNLLSNAARYTDEGGVTVIVTQPDQRIRVQVRDTGPGIRPADIEQIFEPFSQGGQEIWRQKGGSGLGLSISKRFVELHHGRMWVESAFGEGTTFSFELPISSDLGPIARPGHQIREDWIWRERQSWPSFPDSHYNPRFVVCDETGDLEAFLASWSSDIEFVSTRGIVQTIETLKEAPAQTVLLNDRSLDAIWSQAAAIQQRAANTPILGCSIERDADRARALGVLDHLIKPVIRADIKAALEALDNPVKRILVVDDDPDVLTLFRDMLLTCDETLDVSAANGGKAALFQLRSAPPDLLLLDLVMPDVDGWQVLEAMANDEEIPYVPTYLVSAQDPRDKPAKSTFLLTTVNDGLSVTQILQSSVELSKMLTQPGGSLDPVPE
jgi:signal transduction histidine kinase/CheY-like chemotaxis protein